MDMNEFTKIRPVDPGFRAEQNATLNIVLQEDYAILGRRLAARGIDVETVTEQVARFAVAVPSWGTGTGGTRFARFPGGGEPANVFDKVADCAVINSLTGATPTISPHFPWDEVADFAGLRQFAASFGMGFDAVNSNTFQDHPDHGDHPLSYKFGSLSHTDPAVRAQAIQHNLACIVAGEQLGSKALTIWIGDGSNFPGQSHFGRAFERYIDSVKQIAAAMPADWSVFLEHKIYEPAFYSTVIQDWGSSLLAAQEVGPQARCLVDLGHHAPNVNIEMIVSRLIHAGKLAGFHFNDSKYGDDDLDAGAIDPYRLFLVFNELVDVESGGGFAKAPAYMIDQSHNVTDPIESLISSAIEIQRAYAQALLVDRQMLAGFQEGNDPMMANQEFKKAFTTDVAPILATARARKGAAIDPLAAYRASGYRQSCVAQRPARRGGGGGIV
jgi:L-rhamnose isomerase/sugar isomerase